MYAVYFLFGLIAIVFLYYLFNVIGWIRMWKREQQEWVERGAQGVSIIIPFRNENENLIKYVPSLLKQLQEVQDVEIIFINDHSTDGGEAVIKQLNDARIHCYDARNDGKKRAVQQGVALARYPYILTLDADIALPEGWLMAIVHTTRSNVDFGILPLMVNQRAGLFARLQHVEFLSLLATTGASAMEGHPLMCNGAHLLFKKKFYERNQHCLNFEVSSGDDMFLMESLTKEDTMLYFAKPALLATMEPETSFRTLIRQRIRWAGKTRYLRSMNIKLFGATVVFLQLSFWVLFVLSVTTEYSFGFFVSYFFIKMFFDLWLLRAAAARFKMAFSTFYGVLLSLLYPIYAFLIPLLSLFITPQWKGRKISV
jgi:cellulose synthase/poly-beta-1,6-N-acetylglucosamine synthase-like glycosyltransferase